MYVFYDANFIFLVTCTICGSGNTTRNKKFVLTAVCSCKYETIVLFWDDWCCSVQELFTESLSPETVEAACERCVHIFYEYIPTHDISWHMYAMLVVELKCLSRRWLFLLTSQICYSFKCGKHPMGMQVT